MKKLFNNLIFKLVLGVIIGILIGSYASKPAIGVVITIKYILGQIIFFAVPLIILGFITPSIAKLKQNASKFVGITVLIAYISSVAAAFLSMVAGYALIPKLSIASNPEGLKNYLN